MSKNVISVDGNGGCEVYCPVCGRVIVASNINEVQNGVQDGYIFIHDDVIHDESDILALSSGVQ